MSHSDWYLIGFVLTAIAAFILWILSAFVYRNNKKNYLNRTLAVSMVFMGLWFLSGFGEKILSTPSNTFTLWTFRWAYASGIMAIAFFFLFAIGIYLDGSPTKWVKRTAILISILAAAISCTPLVIESASYNNGVLKSTTGPVFPVASIMILVPSLFSIYLIERKWAHSKGIDHARTSVVLFGIIVFFPIFAVSIFVLPAITGNDISTSYAYLAGLIPVGFTSYAIIRLRLLDTRIILRRTSVFMIGTMVLSIPLILLFLLLGMTDFNPTVEYTLVLLVFMILIYFAPEVWRRIRALSSRLFFSELYDESQLLEVVSSRLVAQSQPDSGLLTALGEIVGPLGLNEVGIIIPPKLINDSCWHFNCSQNDDGSVSVETNDNCHFLSWLEDVNFTAVTEELHRWPKNKDEARLALSMEASGLSACVPISVQGNKVGYMLVGEKITKKALTSTDFSFLEKAGERFGLYIDNYSLSTRLSSQLSELKRVYSDLHKAYGFKSEVVQVASHEFRTPITVINGFARTLLVDWDNMKESERSECLDGIVKACGRVMNLTNKFLNISDLEEGNVSVAKIPIRVGDLVQSICSEIRQEDLERLMVDADPNLYIISDPRHLTVMLLNLLENAFRFSPVDSPVILRVWVNSVCGYIQIQDYGVGIPQKEREKIFEPFVRLESLAHHSRGMGLGLYIVRLLSSRLGVEVEIDSTEESGTTITISFEFD